RLWGRGTPAQCGTCHVMALRDGVLREPPLLRRAGLHRRAYGRTSGGGCRRSAVGGGGWGTGWGRARARVGAGCKVGRTSVGGGLVESHKPATAAPARDVHVLARAFERWAFGKKTYSTRFPRRWTACTTGLKSPSEETRMAVSYRSSKAPESMSTARSMSTPFSSKTLRPPTFRSCR